MSNREQALSGIVGGIVGFVVSGFNPAGAFAGFQYAISSAALVAPPDELARRESDVAADRPHRA
jgi:hypothetical protein